MIALPPLELRDDQNVAIRLNPVDPLGPLETLSGTDVAPSPIKGILVSIEPIPLAMSQTPSTATGGLSGGFHFSWQRVVAPPAYAKRPRGTDAKPESKRTTPVVTSFGFLIRESSSGMSGSAAQATFGNSATSATRQGISTLSPAWNHHTRLPIVRNRTRRRRVRSGVQNSVGARRREARPLGWHRRRSAIGTNDSGESIRERPLEELHRRAHGTIGCLGIPARALVPNERVLRVEETGLEPHAVRIEGRVDARPSRRGDMGISATPDEQELALDRAEALERVRRPAGRPERVVVHASRVEAGARLDLRLARGAKRDMTSKAEPARPEAVRRNVRAPLQVLEHRAALLVDPRELDPRRVVERALAIGLEVEDCPGGFDARVKVRRDDQEAVASEPPHDPLVRTCQLKDVGPHDERREPTHDAARASHEDAHAGVWRLDFGCFNRYVRHPASAYAVSGRAVDKGTGIQLPGEDIRGDSRKMPAEDIRGDSRKIRLERSD